MSQPIILGTAGHIDHGKTSLVRALTGIDTDRLPEEKARGITIELGFAYLDALGRRFGIIDVPGHERFVRTMVAGAGGVDVVLVIVAADEGVMPQTREHLDICGLLGIRHGLVVLTKTDLVDDEFLELARADVAEALQGTFLEGAPMLPVAVPPVGEPVGLEALLDALDGVLPAEQNGRRPGGVFRLPIDRVFAMKGFGTVITGTLVSGSVAVGDDVEVLPASVGAKVRGIQVHGESVSRAEAGQRTAINVMGMDRDEVERGHVLSHPQSLAASNRLDGWLRLLADRTKPLRHRSRFLFHCGTATARVTIHLLDREEVEPGAEAYVQLRLDRPFVALPGDRFIVRGFSKEDGGGATVGGGEILLPVAPLRRRRSEGAVSALSALRKQGPLAAIDKIVEAAGPEGLDAPALRARVGCSESRLKDALAKAASDGRLIRYDLERQGWVSAGHFHTWLERTADILRTFHQGHPRKPGIPKEELRQRLAGASPRLFFALLQRLRKGGEITVEPDLVKLSSFQPREDAVLEGVKERLQRYFQEAGATPLRVRELPAELGLDDAQVRPAVSELLAEGNLARIRDDIYLGVDALNELRTRLLAHFAEHDSIDTAAYKALVGGSRKYVIPIAEHFDKEKLTMRVGDVRVARLSRR